MNGDQSGRTKPPSIGEFLFNEIRSAFQDVRQKVLEEGWFGRVVTPAPVIEVGKEGPEAIGLGNRPTIHEGLGQRRPSFEEQWAPRERSAEPREVEKSPSHDLDR
jgi:hypothetical protein